MSMGGIELVLDWLDQRAGFAALLISLFALYLIRNITSRLNKCQSTDMCQVMHTNLSTQMANVEHSVEKLFERTDAGNRDILTAIQEVKKQ